MDVKGPDLEALLRFLQVSPSVKSQESNPEEWSNKYIFTGYRKFLDPDGYPAISTPWGTLNAIDLKTGKYLWKVPFGEYPALAKQGIKNTGTENYGGPVVTASGVLFIGATVYDHKLRAFDTSTGKLLWEADLPFRRRGHTSDLHDRRPPVCRNRRQQRANSERPARRRLRSLRSAKRYCETVIRC